MWLLLLLLPYAPCRSLRSAAVARFAVAVVVVVDGVDDGAAAAVDVAVVADERARQPRQVWESRAD